ncbi:alpha/beta fold hydrolase [Parasulfitobacter algicola]|uniref:Alpha/beta hydrolase n=1 Tax=Parasulfitobacter algicola TaxID=2614809 RepID=A0ABX2IQG4_9RHOB|nr:alpha/beta hydrolase [Sulfitobacter algicola]NSX55112.1 alpha/beta hydrolase [Sulfitobacter algicola]
MTEPLVLIPGMMCDARLYGPQINTIANERAVMVAPITTGERVEEMASDILTVAPPKFALAGLSMGGIVAMEVQRRAPDRVTRIALLDTTPLAETPAHAAEREPQIVKVKTGQLIDVMREVMQPKYLAPGTHRIDVLNLVMEMAEALGPDVFIRQSRALQKRKDQQKTLRQMKCPVLILCGEHDTMTPVKRHEFMAELIEHANLKIIEGAGHLPTLEQPQATTQALQDWLRQPYVLQ